MMPTTEELAEGGGVGRLWTGVLAAPSAFLLSLTIDYLLVTPACRRGLHFLPLLGSGAMLLVALGGGLLAWGSWKASGREWPGPGGTRLARSRFMGMLGLMLSGFFALVIAAMWIPNLFLGPCNRY